MNLKKRRLMMNTFFTSQFNNCSLIGLFHSKKKTKTKSTDLARVVLQKICHDKQLSFEQLLEKDGSVFVNEKYFHKIGAEIYKVSKVLWPQLIIDLFEPKNEHPHSLRYVFQLNASWVNTVYYGTESISFPNLLSKRTQEYWTLENFQI